MTSSMPALFVGHGNPMNALQPTAYAGAWERLGMELARPRAVLAISAHWYTPGTRVTAMAAPRTIHDFRGFPPALSRLEYPAPGDPELARDLRDLLAPVPVTLDQAWGLDHGTWSVLVRLFPKADVPVLQLSMDRDQPVRFHYDLGSRLAPLRDRGVLVVGSGNVVHGLDSFVWDWPAEPFGWALRFERRVREAIMSGDHEAIVDYVSWGRDAALAAPTPEHLLPLLYVLGMRRATDTVTFPVEGVDGGSISMLAVRLGDPPDSHVALA